MKFIRLYLNFKKWFVEGSDQRIDWPGRKFQFAKELNEPVDVFFGCFNESLKKIQWFIRDHSLSDGIAAFKDLLVQKQISVPEVPKMKELKKPGILKGTYLIFKNLWSIRPIEYPWKKIHHGKKGEACGVAYAFFTIEDTHCLINHCRDYSISLNSFLLWALDHVASDHFLEYPSLRAWLIPVNMRGGVRAPIERNNYTSSITLRLKGNLDAHVIHNKLIKLYQKQLHWGSWIQSNLVQYLSDEKLRMICKKAKIGSFGVFSNLGSWSNGHSKNPAEIWICGPPATSVYPIASACISWNGRLGISLQVHPCLSEDPGFIQGLMIKWITQISEKTNTKASLGFCSWNQIRNQAKLF